MLSVAEPFLEQKMHPTTIITAYRQALDDIISITRDKIRYMAIAVYMYVCVVWTIPCKVVKYIYMNLEKYIAIENPAWLKQCY